MICMMLNSLKKMLYCSNMVQARKLTQEIIKNIIEGVKRRIPYKLIAVSNGIGERCFYNWMTQGLDDIEKNVKSDHAYLVQSIKRAEFDLIGNHLDVLTASSRNWQSHAWILERRWREHFGNDSFEIEMRERIAQLERNMLSNNKTVLNEIKENEHGKENVDSESHQEQGSSSPESECTGRGENSSQETKES